MLLFWAIALFSSCRPALAARIPAALEREIAVAAAVYRIDPKLVQAMMEIESKGEPHSISPKGAKGLLQVMPRTADDLGMANPHHIRSNLMGACQYLRSLLNRFQFDLPKVLAAYNAGPEKVKRYNGIPPYAETQNYVRKVLTAYDRLRKP